MHVCVRVCVCICTSMLPRRADEGKAVPLFPFSLWLRQRKKGWCGAGAGWVCAGHATVFSMVAMRTTHFSPLLDAVSPSYTLAELYILTYALV